MDLVDGVVAVPDLAVHSLAQDLSNAVLVQELVALDVAVCSDGGGLDDLPRRRDHDWGPE